SEIEKLNNYDNYIKHISITKEAFPNDTEIYLNKYLTYCSKLRDKTIQTILKFAGFAILEEISYTRKDGQYLRWDFRSKRDLSGKPFDKGKILSFEGALIHKLNQIIHDISINKGSSLFEDFSSDAKQKDLKI